MLAYLHCFVMSATNFLKPWGVYLAAAIVAFGSTPLMGQTLKAEGGKRWYRGNTHTHTLWSDGDAPPEVSVDWYKQHDYDFLCLSDHNILSEGDAWRPVEEDKIRALKERFGPDWVVERTVTDSATGNETRQFRLMTLNELKKHFEEHESFLLIQSEEITSGQPHDVHVNAINLRELILPANDMSVRDILKANFDAVEEQSKRLGIPMLAHLNHPNFATGVSAEDLIAVGGERYFEVYNGHPLVQNSGNREQRRPSMDRLWDIVISMRMLGGKDRPIYGLATDDTHNYYEQGLSLSNSGRGWIEVLAESLDADSIVMAMKRGDFYATSGVRLDEIRIEKDQISVLIQTKPGVKYETIFIGTRKGFDSTSQEALDKEGNKIPGSSRRYSDEVGRVLSKTSDNPATYRFTGDELYVRAKIVSTQPMENPPEAGNLETAWIQPVTPR